MAKVTREVEEPMVLRDADGNVIAAGTKEIQAHYRGQAVAQVQARADGGAPFFDTAPPVSPPPAARTAQEEGGDDA
jgi:hypothetical protein